MQRGAYILRDGSLAFCSDFGYCSHLVCLGKCCITTLLYDCRCALARSSLAVGALKLMRTNQYILAHPHHFFNHTFGGLRCAASSASKSIESDPLMSRY